MREVARAELEQPKRLQQILEPVLAEIPQVILDEIPGRLREQRLAAVPGRADAGGTVNIDADIALPSHGRFAGVQADTGAHRPRGQPSLRLERGRDRICRAREREEERIALSVDLDSAQSAGRLTHRLPEPG
jgi:hypothetical protein